MTESPTVLFLLRYQIKFYQYTYLYNKPVQWVSSVKYLVATLTCMSSKKIALDFNQMRRTFFGCVNSILNHRGVMSDGETAFSRKLLLFRVIMHLNVLTLQVHRAYATLIACWNSVCSKIFHCKPWTSVRELISCLGRMNFEHLFYKKKLCFLHSLMSCKNDVVSSVMEVSVRSEEYVKAYEFANVKPCVNKTKII